MMLSLFSCLFAASADPLADLGVTANADRTEFKAMDGSWSVQCATGKGEHLFGGRQSLNDDSGIYMAGFGKNECLTIKGHPTPELLFTVYKAAGIKIPPHMMIQFYLKTLGGQLEQLGIKGLKDITPEVVAGWMDPQDAQDPRMLFAVRMKMIIAFIGQQDEKGTAVAHDAERADFVMGEALEKALGSPEINAEHKKVLVSHMVNVMDIFRAIPQMTPHVVFAEPMDDYVAFIRAQLGAYFDDGASKIVSRTVESLASIGANYKGDLAMCDEEIARLTKVEQEMNGADPKQFEGGNKEAALADVARQIKEQEKQKELVETGYKENKCLFEDQLKKYQAQDCEAKEQREVAQKILLLLEGDLKDAFNALVKALRSVLIELHTLPVEDGNS